MDIATATPAQIDGEIARLANIAATVRNTIASANRIIRDAEKDPAYFADGVLERQRATVADCRVKLADLENESAPLRARYQDERWTRVYLVDNSNGHVHTTTACPYTYFSTQFAWITELSGSTPEAVVAKAGGRSCLGCFGAVRDLIVADRPCLIESEKGRATREQREERAAAKAERAAAKAVKAITNPDGSPLRTSESGAVIATLRTALNEYVTTAADALEWEASHARASANPETETLRPGWTARCARNVETLRADAETLLAAIAHKWGMDVDAARVELAPKVAKKVRANR